MASTIHDSTSTDERSGRTELVPVGAPYSLSPYGGTPWTGVALRPEMLTAGPDPLSLLRAFRRRWPLASGCGLLLGLPVMIAVWFFVPVNTEIAAFIQVKAVPDTLLATMRPDPFEVNAFRQTQIEHIKGQKVIRRALRAPGINQLSIYKEQPDPVKWLESELNVSYLSDSEILRVMMSGDKPQELVKVVNAVVAAYFDEIVYEAGRVRKDERDKLEDAYRKQEETISKLRQKKADRAKTLGIADNEHSTQLRLLFDQVATLRSAVTTLGTLVSTAEIEKFNLETKLKVEQDPVKGEALLAKKLAEDRRLQDMKDYYDSLELEAVDEERRSKSPNAGKRLRETMKGVEEAILKRKAQIEQEFSEVTAETKVAELQGELEVAKKRLEKYQEQFKSTSDEFKAREQELHDIKIASVEIDELEETLKHHEALRAEMFKELERKKIEANTPPRQVKGEDAIVPEGSSFARKYLMVGFAGVLGFGLAALAISFREFQTRRITSSVQITDGLGMRVVGSLPTVSRSSRQTPGADVQGMLIESIDGVRTNLIHSQGGEPTQVVMITSALDREGKTTVASQLAASLARCGRRTLLVDGDLRRPAAHRLFELPLEPGLCEVLRGDMEVDDVIRPTRAAGLWMIPAGQYDLESIQALSKDVLGDLLDTLRQRFEFIVVDSAPVLTIADSLMLGQHVDAVILSVIRDVSQAPKVYDACERLRAVGMRILGAVVNGERSAATYRAYAVRS
jgi:polysaccharide biosynthesis transport protein